MSGFLLVVDDQDRVQPIVEAAIGKARASVVGVKDYVQAKRRMVQGVPDLVLGMVSTGGNPKSGLAFCKEMQEHARFREVPVILITNNLTEDVIRGASESGAKGLLSWPVSVSILKNRIVALVPELDKTAAVPSKSVTAPRAMAKTQAAAADPKLQLAQHLLAKVLHNLKTSALLDIVELEEVPRVVAEITRSVCAAGVQQLEPAAQSAASATKKLDGETYIDLDAAFGLKK